MVATTAPSTSGQSTISTFCPSNSSTTISVVITALPRSMITSTPSSERTDSMASRIFSKQVPKPPSAMPPAAATGAAGAIRAVSSTTLFARFSLWDTTTRPTIFPSPFYPSCIQCAIVSNR